MEKALTITNIKKEYSNGTIALKDISFTVPKGELFALLGPNGAGKTTIIGILSGLVTATSGKVEIFGVDIAKNPEKARSVVGLCGQEINFDPWMKPLDVLINQAGYYGIPRSIAIPRANKLLHDLGIADKADKIGFSLSGGMKRRLMIARSLVHEPDLLILDEPTAGVDVEMRRTMWNYLTTLTKKGITIILTTHYLEEAEVLAKNVAIINKGEIVTHGTMEEVLALHNGKKENTNYSSGKLEDVFVQLVSNNT